MESLSVGYRELLPETQIIHDRFHLVKCLNDAIDKVRRREAKKHQKLKESRYALLKNEVNLSEKQRIKFESICGANYEASRFWQIRENSKDLVGINSKELLELFFCWANDGLNKKIKEVSKVIDMFKKHLYGVLACLVMSFSNAIAVKKTKCQNSRGKIYW